MSKKVVVIGHPNAGKLAAIEAMNESLPLTLAEIHENKKHEDELMGTALSLASLKNESLWETKRKQKSPKKKKKRRKSKKTHRSK